MNEDDVFAVTRQGDAHLRSSGTSLSREEIDLLVRFDGTLTVGQVLASLPESARASFPAVSRNLCDRGLISQVELDPLTLQFKADLQKLCAVRDEDADAGLAALRRTGFYVQIAQGRRPARPHTADRPMSVVLVEDDQALAHFTRTYLVLSGFQVRVAANRAEVVDAIRRPPLPDLILLDVVLPDADGFDILTRVRDHPVLQTVPVILLTSKATRESVIRGLAAGADGCSVSRRSA